MIIHVKKCLEEFMMEGISCRELFTLIMIRICYLVFTGMINHLQEIKKKIN